MKLRKIMSLILVLATVLGSMVFTTVSTNAAYEDKVDDNGDPVINYISQRYSTPQEKLADMTMMKAQNGYELYVEEFTGEIAFVDTKTGETLFSNPYDLAAGYNWASASTKKKLLSQLVVTYEDNGVESTMYSYEEAAMRGQIITKNIKNGIRVEYTVGELATTRLVPRMISKTRFESLILNNIKDEANYTRLTSFYKLYDTSDTSLTEQNVKKIQASFPITKQFAVYVCTPDISTKELQTCEKIVKAYCPNYTYEEMDQDHADCDYTVSDEAPANFKMAIEYTIGEDGLEARLPANGIRFDESNFTLTSVTMLPYMGSGSSEFTGYNFIPDGSGALIRFEEVKDTTYNVAGQVYGADYAYNTISGQHSETMRLPVFGIVENKKAANAAPVDPTANPNKKSNDEESYAIDPRGFVAIITEGDSMATLMSEHGGKLHCYNSVYAKFNPRPSDKYNLAASISVASNSSVTKTTARKYSGSYRIKYILLHEGTDYDCSYMGMANAYRDYLESIGTITRLTSEDIEKDIPLYIEAFGSLETTQKVMSFPVPEDTPLTTFDDVKTIYDELSGEGVGNLNFRLTGFYNHGLNNNYPTKIEWIDKVGGEKGFKELIKYAQEKGFNLFPEFDFAYMKTSGWFDGVNFKRDLVKSINDKYMSKRMYDAAMQSFESDFALAISPSRYGYFISKLDKKFNNYKDLGLTGISVSTLGTDLNSDFDEDDPYNREDSKGFTTEVLRGLNEKFSVMVDGGNAYTLPYVDHIIDISTQSSNFLKAGASIPFTAMVLHGYVNYSGGAVNMEGDVRYALLKSIENGASLYFTLCYQNTSALKESDAYNKYYSISYDIWKNDMVDYYKMLNEVLADLQTERITEHQLLDAQRTITEEEQALTPEELAQKKAEEEAAQKEAERQKKRDELLKSRGQAAESKSNGNNKKGSGEKGDNTSKVATESGSVVRVGYENGASFIINYNSFDVEATFNGKTYPVEALGFIRIDN